MFCIWRNATVRVGTHVACEGERVRQQSGRGRIWSAQESKVGPRSAGCKWATDLGGKLFETVALQEQFTQASQLADLRRKHFDEVGPKVKPRDLHGADLREDGATAGGWDATPGVSGSRRHY